MLGARCTLGDHMRPIKCAAPNALPLAPSLHHVRQRPAKGFGLRAASSPAPVRTLADGGRVQAMTRNIQVNVGDQVFFEEGGEEIGAVRKVERDHLVIYIEAAGDFVVQGPQVKAAHHGKVVLDASLVDPRLLQAAQTAHERETD
jgi:hypothetical protein